MKERVVSIFRAEFLVSQSRKKDSTCSFLFAVLS